MWYIILSIALLLIYFLKKSKSYFFKQVDEIFINSNYFLIWDDSQFFNTTLDAENQWFVSIEEVNGCDKPEFQWLKSCELIEYNPIIPNFQF